MIPENISFTGLEVTHSDIENRKLGSANIIPTKWIRYSFQLPSGFYPLHVLDRWIEKNTFGRWASWQFPGPQGRILFVLYFEQLNDAIMFKIRDGDKCYNNDD